MQRAIICMLLWDQVFDIPYRLNNKNIFTTIIEYVIMFDAVV